MIAAIREVVDAKGLTVVADKNGIAYDGTEVSDDAKVKRIADVKFTDPTLTKIRNEGISMSKFKNIFLVAFVLLSIIAITNPNITYAAASPVGVVNYQLLMNQHPDMVQAQETINAAIAQAKSNFDAKSANMSDQGKQSYYQQLQQGLQVKKQDLLEAIRDKVNAAVKTVADSKGLTIIVDKSVVVHGGQDITDDVMKKITGK